LQLDIAKDLRSIQSNLPRIHRGIARKEQLATIRRSGDRDRASERSDTARLSRPSDAPGKACLVAPEDTKMAAPSCPNTGRAPKLAQPAQIAVSGHSAHRHGDCGSAVGQR